MPQLADIRKRLEAITSKAWHTNKPTGAIATELIGKSGRFLGDLYNSKDADFAAHAPEDMRALLDAWDFVLDGKPIGYVTAQLDEIAEELETAGDHAMAQALSRLAVMLERLA